MATVRELVDVTKRAIRTFDEVRRLEVLCGAPEQTAAFRGEVAAMRQALAEMLKLLEDNSCDSLPGC